jgi:protein phosphatase
MQYSFFAMTDPGQVRTNNEDCVSYDEASGVAVLADGMGGYNAGEVASGMAVAFIQSELVKWLETGDHKRHVDQIANAINMCIVQANYSILNAALSNPLYEGMGTTIVTGLFVGNCLILGHVGDSRCYRWRAGKLIQITKDHSLLQEQVDAGLLTPEQAAIAPGKNLLTRALGVENDVQVEIHEHSVLAGDVYLMCSDGLSDMLTDAQLASTMSKCGLLQEMGAELITKANAAGGRDNIGILLAQAKDTSGSFALMSRLFGNP